MANAFKLIDKSQEETSPLMVTIRCTAYNHEPYIRQCLEGFVMQKTNFRFEAIVHDDASTDGTVAIIREYAEKYPDIIKPIYETENQYSKRDGSVRRIMDMHTHGKYTAICEGDDFWIDPLKLQKQVDFLEANPECSMCFHNAIVVNERSGVQKRIFSFNNLQESKFVTFEELINSWIIPTASIMHRSVYIQNRPEWFNLIYSGDFSLSLMMFLKGKIYYMDNYMSVYRLQPNSISAVTPIAYNCSQLIKLLLFFDKYTGLKYHVAIDERIKVLKKESKFYTLRCKSIWHVMINMPIYTLKRIINRYCNK